MLNGNIARLSLSDDREELLKTISYISLRCSRIYALRLEELRLKTKKQD